MANASPVARFRLCQRGRADCCRLYPYGVAVLLTRSGAITVFMVLGVMLVLCALILFCFGIETRKISLEEISTLA